MPIQTIQGDVFVHLFKKYRSLSPPHSADPAVYLMPLKIQQTTSWYSVASIGRKKLSKAVLS